jgi:tight adherence protein B
MTIGPALLGAVALAVVLAAGWVASIAAERRRRALQSRLAAVVATAPQGGAAAAPEAAMALRRALSRGGRGLPVLPARLYQWLHVELHATGDRLKLRDLILAAAAAAVLAIGFLAGVAKQPAFVVVPLALAAAVAMPLGVLRFSQGRFQRQFVDGFPDALDVIVRGARAGLPVLDAIEAAATTVSGPVASEFRAILDQMRIGLDLEDLLEHAGDRIRVNDFRFFAAAIVLQRRTGGSLAETLANLSALIRRRRELRLKVRALTAESRATAYLLAALPVIEVAYVYMINRPLMSLLFTDPRGRVVLVIAVVMLIFGMLMMRSMIKNATR